VPFIELNFRI